MAGGGKLTIEAGNAILDDAYAARHAEVAAGQYVMLAVTDTGTGMSPEVIDRVFEPFFTTKGRARAPASACRMVYGFVKQSGGHVKIYSELGHGTTVKLYLPRSRRSGGRAAAPVADGAGRAAAARRSWWSRTTTRSALRSRLLQRLGYQVLQRRGCGERRWRSSSAARRSTCSSPTW